MLVGRGIYGCKKHAAANCFLQPYIPLLYTVSAEVGVAWGIFHDIIVYIFI